ncbi:MAG: DUF2508 family protein [Lachnospiraceae bacterium]|nr:DUF2508 family protein [Lachnospiraceae bacterium]
MKYFFSHSTYDASLNTLSAPISSKEQLMQDLQKTRIELEIAYSGFDNVTDPALIDCYIYKLNAVMKRYQYLMEKAAEQSLLPEKSPYNSYAKKPLLELPVEKLSTMEFLP